MKGACFTGPNVKSSYYFLLPIKHWVPQIWELGLHYKEKSGTLNGFETKVKSWYPDQCTCILFKSYISQLAFIRSIQAPFSGRISLYVIDTKAYLQYLIIIQVNIYLFKVNKRNISKRSEICSKLTIKALMTSRLIFPFLRIS